jgi:hypothetical protein
LPLRIGWALLMLLILAAAGELAIRGVRRALSDMQDFAVIYASARAFDAGQNPYDAAAIRAAWLEGTHNGPIAPPVDLALYPPSTYLVLSPLALLDWNRVQWAWIGLNLIAVAVLILALTRYAPCKLSPQKRKACGAHLQAEQEQVRSALRLARVPQKRKGCGAHRRADRELARAALRLARVPQETAWIAAFILGFGPIHTAIYKGQLAVVVAAVLALALVAEGRQAAVPAAILIGFAASLKPQIAAPVVFLYLLQKQWKALAVVAGVTSGLLGIAWLRLSWAGVSWLGPLLRNVRLAAAPGGVYDPSPSNPIVYQLVNASALLRRLTSSQSAIALFLAAVAVVAGFFLWKRGQYRLDLLADPAAFSAACVLGLVVISHRYYDAVVLVFVFVWALTGSRYWRGPTALISIAGCLVMAFPLPALFMTSGLARAPFAIPQILWDVVVVQHESWVLLMVLVALTAALAGPPAERPTRATTP